MRFMQVPLLNGRDALINLAEVSSVEPIIDNESCTVTMANGTEYKLIQPLGAFCSCLHSMMMDRGFKGGVWVMGRPVVQTPNEVTVIV